MTGSSSGASAPRSSNARSSAETPRVVANCATSLDGRLAYAGGRRARLSGPADLRRVQRLRADSDAILVGVGTILQDDPSLRIHEELLDGARPNRPLLRVVLDSRGRIPPDAKVLDRSAPTLVATTTSAPSRYPAHIETFSTDGARVELRALLAHLARRSVHQLLVEGGPTVFASFFRDGLVDELTVYVAPVLIGGRTAPPLLGGEDLAGDSSAIPLQRESATPLDDGVLLRFRPVLPRSGSAANAL